MKSKRNAIRRAFKGFTFSVIICYILALSGYFFSPLQWKTGGLFNPGFVFGWLILFVCMIAWFFLDKKIFLFVLLVLAMGFVPFSHSFSVKTGKPFQQEKSDDAIRIMQWNCEDLGGNLSWDTDKNTGRKRAEAFIKQYQPDVICLQDYSDFTGSIYRSNEAFLRDTLGFPFHIFALQTSQIKPYGIIKSGLKIVSKYPILAHGIHFYKNISVPEAILWADIVYRQKKIRVVTTHFRSFYLSAAVTITHGLPAYLQTDSAIIMGNSVLKKLLYFQEQHTHQAIQLRAFLDTCSVPVVLAADLNNIPSANLYAQVKGKMKDGFRGNATGLGATYNYLLPNIRIDYLLHHPTIRLLQWKHFRDGFFDHDHLLGDYSLH